MLAKYSSQTSLTKCSSVCVCVCPTTLLFVCLGKFRGVNVNITNSTFVCLKRKILLYFKIFEEYTLKILLTCFKENIRLKYHLSPCN